MAGKSPLKHPVYVIDTSYLDELYAVPGKSTEAHVGEVRSRFRNAIIQKGRFYVPVPCIFELGNHIGAKRSHDLARKLLKDVEASLQDQGPWILTPNADFQVLSRLCRAFVGEFVQQAISLTDAFTIFEARRLKRERYKGKGFRVHIWTKDRSLKSHEPDREPDPFVGSGGAGGAGAVS